MGSFSVYLNMTILIARKEKRKKIIKTFDMKSKDAYSKHIGFIL